MPGSSIPTRPENVGWSNFWYHIQKITKEVQTWYLHIYCGGPTKRIWAEICTIKLWFIAVNVHLLHAFHTFQRNDRGPWKCIVVRFDLDLGKRQNLIHHQKPDYDNWEFLLTYKSKISFKFTEHAENVCILISIFHFSQHLQSSPNVIHVKYRGVLMSSPFHWKCYLKSSLLCFFTKTYSKSRPR